MPHDRGLRRSARLFRDFLHEQDDPARFYTALARDSVAMISSLVDLSGALVADIGAGPLYFARAFADAGSTYVAAEMDVGEFAGTHDGAGLTVAARGEQLPFHNGAFDVTFSSNVLEHVPDPRPFCEEMVRVTRPGGIVVVSFTNWLSPWGGHETSPWHYLGGEYAVRRYRRRHGHDPKNRIGHTLFRLSVAEMLDLADDLPGATLVEARPRYWPSWGQNVLKVPGAREFLTWNLWMVWRKTDGEAATLR